MKTPAFIQEVNTRKIPVLFWMFVAFMILRRQPPYVSQRSRVPVEQAADLDRRALEQKQQMEQPLAGLTSVEGGAKASEERKAVDSAAIPFSPTKALTRTAQKATSIVPSKVRQMPPTEDRIVAPDEDVVPAKRKTQSASSPPQDIVV
jgi:hypothetical protein